MSQLSPGNRLKNTRNNLKFFCFLFLENTAKPKFVFIQDLMTQRHILNYSNWNRNWYAVTDLLYIIYIQSLENFFLWGFFYIKLPPQRFYCVWKYDVNHKIVFKSAMCKDRIIIFKTSRFCLLTKRLLVYRKKFLFLYFIIFTVNTVTSIQVFSFKECQSCCHKTYFSLLYIFKQLKLSKLKMFV